MNLRDTILMLLVTLVWGANVPLSALAVNAIPPVFFCFIRFSILTIILLPLLLPVPRQMFLIFLVSVCMGGVGFIAQFIALKHTSASNLAIIAQLSLPIATILSLIFLKETIRWRRGLGMVLAFAGVVIVIYRPQGIDLGLGNMLALATAFLAAIGTVLMKKMRPIEPLRFQAWNSLLSLIPLSIFTLSFEHNQIPDLMESYKLICAILFFSVLFVSLYGHTMYFHLVKKHEVTLVMPFTLLTPIWAVILSSLILNEKITVQLIIGGIISIIGVAMIALRENISLGKDTAKSTVEF